MSDREYQSAHHLIDLLEHVDAGGSLTLAEVAARCGVATAAAKRYIEFVEERRPLKTRWRDGVKHWFAEPSSPSTGDEVTRAAALAFAVKALQEMEGAPHYTALCALSEQHANRLTDAHADQLGRLERTFHVVRPAFDRRDDRAEVVRQLGEGIRARRTCSFRYRPLRGDAALYVVRPWSLTLHKHQLLLVAGKQQGNAWRRRHFHVDGIAEVELMDERFPPPDDELDHTRAYRDSFGIFTDLSQSAVDVHLRVRGPAAIAVKQRPVHASQTELVGPDGLEVRLRVRLCPELEAWILGWMPYVAVIGPNELRQRLMKRISEYASMTDP